MFNLSLHNYSSTDTDFRLIAGIYSRLKGGFQAISGKRHMLHQNIYSDRVLNKFIKNENKLFPISLVAHTFWLRLPDLIYGISTYKLCIRLWREWLNHITVMIKKARENKNKGRQTLTFAWNPLSCWLRRASSLCCSSACDLRWYIHCFCPIKVTHCRIIYRTVDFPVNPFTINPFRLTFDVMVAWDTLESVMNKLKMSIGFNFNQRFELITEFWSLLELIRFLSNIKFIKTKTWPAQDLP